MGWIIEQLKKIISSAILFPARGLSLYSLLLKEDYRNSHYSPINVFTITYDVPIPTTRFHVKLIVRFVRDTCILESEIGHH